VSAVANALGTVLWLYFLILLARLVFDYVQLFARSWEPKGVVLILAEAIYTVTDPPLKFLRRFIPPLRLGQVSLDLSFLVLVLLIGFATSLLSAV
jgi:YggT family protein